VTNRVASIYSSCNNHDSTQSTVKGRQPKHTCTVCSRWVTTRSKAIDCDTCQRWTHIKCTSEVSIELYCNQDIEFNFTCNACTIAELPFVNNSDYNSDVHLSTSNSSSTADEDNNNFTRFVNIAWNICLKRYEYYTIGRIVTGQLWSVKHDVFVLVLIIHSGHSTRRFRGVHIA